MDNEGEDAQKAKEYYEFKKQLDALKKFRGRGTELISVYIPPKYQISDVTAKLREEAGAATNIKSTATRKNVLGALEKIIAYLKNFREPPLTGIAVFCGNVSDVEGRPDIQLFSIIPPAPINVQFYRCEPTFVLEPLLDLSESRDVYGLVVMDGKEATIAVLEGKQIRVIKQIHSTAHAKTHKGGQCLHESSLVQMANGETKEIQNVQPGENVLSFDWKTMRLVSARCEKVFARRGEKALSIRTNSPTIELKSTPEHRFFVIVSNGIEEKYAEDLQAGDVLLAAQSVAENIIVSDGNQKQMYSEDAGRGAIIESISPVEPSGFYYDLSIPERENFIAQGIVVHNSSQRFGRLREEGIEFFHKRIGEAMDSYLGIKNFKGVIVGGPGPAKEGFLKEAAFNYQIKVLGMVDTGYTDEFGLREILEKSGDLLAEHEAIKERKLLDEFMREIAKGGLATYGFDAIRKALTSGQARALLVSEGLTLYEIQLQCSQCGARESAVSPHKIEPGTEEDNHTCGGRMRVVSDADLVNELVGIAENAGIPIHFISRDSAEGQQFFATFSGLGVFLRYK